MSSYYPPISVENKANSHHLQGIDTLSKSAFFTQKTTLFALLLFYLWYNTDVVRYFVNPGNLNVQQYSPKLGSIRSKTQSKQ